MKTRIQVVFNDVEWAAYTLSFGVSRNNHHPTIPPSYPVLVVSSPIAMANDDPDEVQHSFVEMGDLRRALGI